MRLRILVAPVAAALLLNPSAAVPAGASADPGPSSSPVPQPGAYRPPVGRLVIEPFRAPPTPYAAGHRGIDYRTVPGEPVRAIGAGSVTFAGLIARQRYVTVRHPDGLDSTYSYLATITVRRGQVVGAGEQLGTAGPILHLGARRDGRYLDPSSLFRPIVGRGRPILVPTAGARITRVS